MSTAVEPIKKHTPARSSTWRDRFRALKNIPPVLGMLWNAAPRVVVFDLACQLISALTPLALLIVGRYIIDDIVQFRGYHDPVPHYFWWLVALEFALASIAATFTRVIDYCDQLLAEKF